MDNRQHVLELDVVHEREDVYRLMSSIQGSPISTETRHLAHRLMDETRSLVHPRAIYTILDVRSIGRNRIELESNHTLEGTIAQYLTPAHRLALFVATIGPELEDAADEAMQRGDKRESWILDTIGSVAIESTVEALVDHLLWNETPDQEAITAPICPGYCGLPLDQNVPIFGALDAGVLDVNLSAKLVIKPFKSISGLVGFGDQEQVARQGVPCDWCAVGDCRMGRHEKRSC